MVSFLPEARIIWSRLIWSGLAYFVKNVAKYAQDDYQHTEQDLLRNRIKTTGIIEVSRNQYEPF